MPLTYGQMISDLQLVGMATLINTDFGSLLNRAQSEEVEDYPWTFRLTNSVLYTVAPYSTGAITCTPGSSIVTGIGTAWTSAFNGFQLRFGNSGPTLFVATVSSATSLTLAQPYLGVPQTAINYTLQQSFYPIPNASEVTAVRNTVLLEKTSRETINLEDPQRLSVGGNPCLAWAPAPYLNGVLQIEMWPVSSAAVPYVVEYRAQAIPMVNPTDMPQVASAVLEAKAMMYAAQASYASNAGPQWLALAQTWEKRYTEEREKAEYADRKRALTQKAHDPSPFYGLDVLPSHDPY